MAGAYRPKWNSFAASFVAPYPNEDERSDGKQLFSVPYPTCGFAPGDRCLLHSGAPRSGPHVDRKLSVAEAIETKSISCGPGRP